METLCKVRGNFPATKTDENYGEHYIETQDETEERGKTKGT